MKENPTRITTKTVIHTESGDLNPNKKAVSIYNRWVASGKPLPWVYVILTNSAGDRVPIHVTEIDRILNS